MKIHTKKKIYRREMQKAANAGLINGPDGKFIKREHVADNSMKRDYAPQVGKR
jgi:hypothetical protein